MHEPGKTSYSSAAHKSNMVTFNNQPSQAQHYDSVLNYLIKAANLVASAFITIFAAAAIDAGIRLGPYAFSKRR
jgi:hypothetical protein